MSGVRRGAKSVLKWFSALYVVLIIIQVFLAGEGIFGLKNIEHSDKCNKAGAAPCIADSKALDPHRALGFFLTLPGALLFLIVALLAWHPNKRVRTVSIVVPILTFLQLVLPGLGRWGGAFHPLNAIVVLGMFGWLAHRLRQEEPQETVATAPLAVPAA
jgi:asparagine N-glycosylation enzyme membrane subunit Stt3